MYRLIKPLLFSIDPESGHNLIMNILAGISNSAFMMRSIKPVTLQQNLSKAELLGKTVPGLLGLAAGLDKDARAFPALQALGFAWVETGTVTPKPQIGNPRPRLFRLTQDQAIINRMGFNSCGIDRFTQNVKTRHKYYNSILGINIGKNANTPLETAEQDYLYCFNEVYSYADYVAVNVSSPNTKSLRDLQQTTHLARLLKALEEKRPELENKYQRYVPIVVKISPDLPESEVAQTAQLIMEHKMDGVIATNTTTQRPDGLKSRHKNEPGGLSGKPLESLSNSTIHFLRQYLDTTIPIIGVGGIHDSASALTKLSAGAQSLQCYTAFIFQGPRVLNKLSHEINQKYQQLSRTTLK